MHSNCSDNMNRFDGKFNAASSTISNEFHRFIGDVEELFKATTLVTGDDLIRATQKLGARIDAAKDSVEEISDSMIARAKKTATNTNQYVHNHSWVVVGASVAASLVVGYLVARRS